jgi:hypothetical protein
MESWIFKGYYPFALNRQEEFCHLSDLAESLYPNLHYSSPTLLAEATLVAYAILPLSIGRNPFLGFYD